MGKYRMLDENLWGLKGYRMSAKDVIICKTRLGAMYTTVIGYLTFVLSIRKL